MGVQFRNVEFSLPPADCLEPVGTPPQLDYVAIDRMVIDDRYQRPLSVGNRKAIRKIARNFDWALFSTVLLAKLDDGRFAIVDGQHRVHAAAMVGIEKVPCQISKLDAIEQAKAFAAVNGDVIKVTVWQLYKAALAAGVEWAVEATRICQLADCEMMVNNNPSRSKKAGEIYAVSWVRNLVEHGQGDRLGTALKLLRKSEWGSKSEFFTFLWLRSICSALMDRDRLLVSHGPDAILKALNQLDLYTMQDQVDDRYKAFKRNAGAGVAKADMLQAALGTALDKAFPIRVALPGGAA